MERHGPRGASADEPPRWLADGSLLVQEWGFDARTLLVDASTGARRVLGHSVCWSLVTAGELWACVVQPRSGAMQLQVGDRAGAILVRRALPAALESPTDGDYDVVLRAR